VILRAGVAIYHNAIVTIGTQDVPNLMVGLRLGQPVYNRFNAVWVLNGYPDLTFLSNSCAHSKAGFSL
jgi:hypothetical protein